MRLTHRMFGIVDHNKAWSPIDTYLMVHTICSNCNYFVKPAASDIIKRCRCTINYCWPSQGATYDVIRGVPWAADHQEVEYRRDRGLKTLKTMKTLKTLKKTLKAMKAMKTSYPHVWESRSNSVGDVRFWPISGSDWHRMGHTWVFRRSFSSTFWLKI